MTIEDKLTTIANNVPLVYDAGYNKGKAEGGDNPLYYATQPQTLFIGADFPKDYELTLRFKNTPNTFQQMFFNARCPKSVKIIIENHTTNVSFQNTFNLTSSTPNLVTVDLTDIDGITDGFQMFSGQKLLTTVIGVLDLSACTGTNATTNIFRYCSALGEVRFKENTIPKSISFEYCSDLSKATIQSIIDGLAPITDGVARTLTLHADLKAKLTDEQKATITTTKGWTLA